MRINTTELLAAVAFIASLARYYVSGSKTLPSDLRSSDHPKDREGDASDNRTSQSNDEAHGEDRTWPWSVPELPALTGRAEEQIRGHGFPTLAAQGLDHVTHAYDAPERLEASGTVATPVLDLLSLVGKEQAPVAATPVLDPLSLVGKEQAPVAATPVLDLLSLVGKEQAPVAAPRSEADSTRIIENANALAPRSKAYMKEIIELAFEVATKSEAVKERFIDDALAPRSEAYMKMIIEQTLNVATKSEAVKERFIEQTLNVATKSEAYTKRIIEQTFNVAFESEAVRERFIEEALAVASRSEAYMKRIIKEAFFVARQLEGVKNKFIEHALAVAPQRNDERSSIIEQLQARTDPKVVSAERWKLLKEEKTQDWTAEELMLELVASYGANDDGFTKLASALREAKAGGTTDGEIFHALEAAMLEAWKKNGIRFDRSFDILELFDLKTGEGLMNDKLELLERYIFVSPDGHRGGRTNINSFLLHTKLKDDYETYLQIIRQAGKQSTIANEMLVYLVKWWLHSDRSHNSIIGLICLAQISESAVRHLLKKMRKGGQGGKDLFKAKWIKTVTALQKALDSDWEVAVEEAVKRMEAPRNSGASSSKRKRGPPSSHGAAPAPKKPALKRQKIAGPSIRR